MREPYERNNSIEIPTGMRGSCATEIAKKTTLGKSALSHLVKYERVLEESHIKTDRKNPTVLPNYNEEKGYLT